MLYSFAIYGSLLTFMLTNCSCGVVYLFEYPYHNYFVYHSKEITKVQANIQSA